MKLNTLLEIQKFERIFESMDVTQTQNLLTELSTGHECSPILGPESDVKLKEVVKKIIAAIANIKEKFNKLNPGKPIDPEQLIDAVVSEYKLPKTSVTAFVYNKKFNPVTTRPTPELTACKNAL